MVIPTWKSTLRQTKQPRSYADQKAHWRNGEYAALGQDTTKSRAVCSMLNLMYISTCAKENTPLPYKRMWRHELSLYKRGKYFHCSVSTPGTGRIRCSTKETTLTRARFFESQLLAKLTERQTPIHLRKVPLLRDFANDFLKYVESYEKKPTRDYYRGGWNLLSGTMVASMRLDHIDTEIAQMLSFPGSGSNANKALRTLSLMLSKAARKGYIASAPQIIKRTENERTALFSPVQEAALLHHAGQPLRDIALIVFDMGFRPGEAMRIDLSKGDVDMFRKAIYRRRGKVGKSDRWVLMSDRVFEALAARMAGLPKDCSWLFPSNGKNGRVSTCGHLTTVQKHFERAKRDADLPRHLLLYSARHTSMTNLAEETGNPKLVQQFGGHHRATTTMKYIHPDATAARDAINKINRERAEVVFEASRHNLSHTTSVVQ